MGVVVQLGGQTPLKLARALEAAGVPILGTSPTAIDAAEDRRQFEALARELGVRQPPNGTAETVDAALEAAERIGYPVLVRPSYVLGGRAMRIVYDAEELRGFFDEAARVAPGHPVLIDSFLEDAFEADVDAICDGTHAVIGGVMQHIEDAGIHSGDSACVLPPYLITEAQVEEMREYTRAFARRLGRGGADQRAVCHQGWRGLRARGQPARVAHHSVRLEDHRRAAGGGGGGRDGRARRWRRSGSPTIRCSPTWRSRKRSFRSPSSPASTPASVRRCVPPAR